MTNKPKYEWDEMWDVIADPQAMFISALFSVKKDALADLMEIASRDDTQLEEWAANLGITAPWFIPKALDVVASSTETAWLAPFHFEHAAWDDRWTSEPDYEAAVRAAFDKHLAAYMMRDANPDLMQPDEKRNPQHFIWAVMYFVERLSEDAIAKKVNVTQQDVSSAVGEIAERIGLQMRKRGRPKKIEQKNTT